MLALFVTLIVKNLIDNSILSYHIPQNKIILFIYLCYQIYVYYDGVGVGTKILIIFYQKINKQYWGTN